MALEELSDDALGRLVQYDRRPYYSPDPLPPDTELKLEEELYETLSEATFWLGKLSGFSQTTDFAPVLYTSLLRKEAMESSEIEGTNIDYNALYSFETGRWTVPNQSTIRRQSSTKRKTCKRSSITNKHSRTHCCT